jgi:hypothetical protein
MSGTTSRSKSSSGRRQALQDSEHDENFPKKRSLVDYSKISDRHVDDARYEKQRQQAAAASSSPSSMAVALPVGATKMSSQMQAVVRLMTGKEERTIAEKIADSNRPTWEQYKKDNQDKFEFAGLDQKKMEEYRRELDKEREKILSRGINRGSKKKIAESSEGSESSDSDSRRNKKKSKPKHKREKKHHEKKSSRKRSNKHKKHKKYESNSEEDDDDSDRERIKRKRPNSRKIVDDSKIKGTDNADDAYRLSSFFAKDSSSESSN